MNLLNKVNPRNVIIGVLLSLIGILVGGLLVLSTQKVVSGEAFFGLLGVLIGALIPTVSQSWSAGRDRKNQLRIAALDKRLEVHQQAYSLWSQLASMALNSEEIHEYVIKCQKWWNENCLYLEPKARVAFRLSYTCAHSHRNFMDDRKETVKQSPKDKLLIEEKVNLVNQNWENILSAGQAIVESVELPAISGDKNINEKIG